MRPCQIESPGGPVPLDEVLPIARQIADALEAAHEHGIVHRDLKPANIKITSAGVVKVLDFGLAKLAEQPAAPAGSSPLTLSPTITSPAMTHVGVILGTAAYMSPEQARGKAADRRSDIWAFGVVVYEMLVGRRLFGGDDVSDTLAFVLTRQPDWSALPAGTPASVVRLLRRCIEKNRSRRLADIADARLELEESTVEAEPRKDFEAARTRSYRPRIMILSIVAAVSLAAVLVVVWAARRTPSLAPQWLNVDLGPDVALVTDPATAAVLSPDGSTLVFVARAPSRPISQLYVRRLDRLQAEPLSGTDDAFGPFFSPDGAWIGFFAGGKLKKVSVTGGAAVTLSDAASGRGGTWGEDDTITFIAGIEPGLTLVRVPSSGGKPEALTSQLDDEATQRWPQWLPGGEVVLYTGHNDTRAFDEANIVAYAPPQ